MRTAEKKTTIQHSGIASFWSRPGTMEVVLCALTFLAYVSTLAFGFVYDDEPQIVRNASIQAWSYLPHYFTSHVWADVYSGRVGNYYRPLFLLWLRVNHAVFGLTPGWWHFTSIACHVLVTYLVFRLAHWLTRDRGTAFLAGLLFGLHPAHIESVAWLSGITDPLMALLFLASLLAYLQYTVGKKKRWLGVAVTALSLALLAKETPIVLPFLIIVWAWRSEPGETDASPSVVGKRAIRDSAIFLAVVAVYLLARAFALRGILHQSAPITWTTMLLTWPSVLLFYVRHLLWPFGLSEFYPSPSVTQISFRDFVGPLLLVLLIAICTVGIMRWLRWSQAARCALALLLLPILPALYLPALTAGDMLHDRYLYLSSAGFAILVAIVVGELADSAGSRGPLVRWGLAATLVAGYAGGTLVERYRERA